MFSNEFDSVGVGAFVSLFCGCFDLVGFICNVGGQWRTSWEWLFARLLVVSVFCGGSFCFVFSRMMSGMESGNRLCQFLRNSQLFLLL